MFPHLPLLYISHRASVTNVSTPLSSVLASGLKLSQMSYPATLLACLAVMRLASVAGFQCDAVASQVA